MYSSTFSDWFCQAVIDYMLGNRTITVFSEFLLKLQSTDPSDLVRLSKIRAEAIATSVSRVLPEGERLLSGWTLFAPEDLNTKMGMKFEEKVLLLVRCIETKWRTRLKDLQSVKALYIIVSGFVLATPDLLWCILWQELWLYHGRGKDVYSRAIGWYN